MYPDIGFNVSVNTFSHTTTALGCHSELFAQVFRDLPHYIFVVRHPAWYSKSQSYFYPTSLGTNHEANITAVPSSTCFISQLRLEPATCSTQFKHLSVSYDVSRPFGYFQVDTEVCYHMFTIKKKVTWQMNINLTVVPSVAHVSNN